MIYHLEIEARDCKITGILNGFPAYRLNATYPAVHSAPINTSLKAGVNQLVITAIPTNITPTSLDYIPTFSIKGCIKKYEPDAVVGPENGVVIQSFDSSNQLAFVISFEGMVQDFSYLLTEEQKIESDDVLKSYVAGLEGLMVAGDAAGLAKEFSPKLKDIASAYRQSYPEMQEGFKTHLQEHFFTAYPIAPLNEHALLFTKWCDGRIWEVTRIKDGITDFFKTLDDDEGYNYSIPVFIGYVDGVLKVVR